MKKAQNNGSYPEILQDDWNINFEEEISPELFLAEAISREQSKRDRQGSVRFLIGAALVLLLLVLIFNVFLGIAQVGSMSMAPAVQKGDRILYSRLVWKLEKGDIVLIETKDGTKLLERIIATEGESLYIDDRDKAVYIDGMLVEEDYVYRGTKTTDDTVEYPVVVEPDHFFVMGDNRGGSTDSRNAEIGQVAKDEIVGKVFFLMRPVRETLRGSNNEGTEG